MKRLFWWLSLLALPTAAIAGGAIEGAEKQPLNLHAIAMFFCIRYVHDGNYQVGGFTH
jgi:hypothetical protein